MTDGTKQVFHELKTIEATGVSHRVILGPSVTMTATSLSWPLSGSLDSFPIYWVSPTLDHMDICLQWLLVYSLFIVSFVVVWSLGAANREICQISVNLIDHFAWKALGK